MSCFGRNSSFKSLIVFVVEIAQHALTGYDAHKGAAVIYNGNEILRHDPLNKLIRLCRDLDGRISVGVQNIGYLQPLALAQTRSAYIDYSPKQVAFADRTDIRSLLIYDRDHGIAVSAHLFESLTECVVCLQKCDSALRRQ